MLPPGSAHRRTVASQQALRRGRILRRSRNRQVLEFVTANGSMCDLLARASNKSASV